MLQSVMKNSHGRLVFPSNFIPELDVTALDSLDTLEEVIQRDFESKAPSGTEILQRIEQGKYARRSDLLRDIAMNLFWTNRYAMTMYDKHVTRWKDVPRNREDVYIPALTPWEDGGRKVEAVREVYPTLDARWDATVEDEVFKTLFDVFAHRRFHATELSAIKPTVEQILADPSQLVARITDYDPNYPVFRDEEILDVHEDVPQLEALRRWSMVLHNQFPWDRSKTELVEARELRDEDYVIVYRPKSRDVQRFIRRATTGHSGRRRAGAPAVEAKAPVRPYKPIVVRDLTVQPRILALAVAGGEEICTNDDLIRNSAYNWSR